jgi:IS30 family transposase
MLERQQIAVFRERLLGVREIGRRLHRAPSTVSRELDAIGRRTTANTTRLSRMPARARARRERTGRLLCRPSTRLSCRCAS